MTALYSTKVLAEALEPAQAVADVLPIILAMAKDNVPNIRFNVARTLELVAPLLGGQALKGDVGPVLDALCADVDRDVVFFAKQARTVLQMGSE